MKNPRHELFCQAIANGEYADAAYETAGFKDHRSGASRLITNRNISRRIAELQAENAQVALLSREDVLGFLWLIVMTPAGEVTANSMLCQEHSATTTSDGETYARIKMPGKIDALRLMSRICGWEKGNKAERDAAKAMGGVAELIQRIRTRK